MYVMRDGNARKVIYTLLLAIGRKYNWVWSIWQDVDAFEGFIAREKTTVLVLLWYLPTSGLDQLFKDTILRSSE